MPPILAENRCKLLKGSKLHGPDDLSLALLKDDGVALVSGRSAIRYEVAGRSLTAASSSHCKTRD